MQPTLRSARDSGHVEPEVDTLTPRVKTRGPPRYPHSDRLRAGNSVAVTATELGYANPSAFSRVFTQRLGRSPSAWLAGLRG